MSTSLRGLIAEDLLRQSKNGNQIVDHVRKVSDSYTPLPNWPSGPLTTALDCEPSTKSCVTSLSEGTVGLEQSKYLERNTITRSPSSTRRLSLILSFCDMLLLAMPWIRGGLHE
jgi:hypothetical protein